MIDQTRNDIRRRYVSAATRTATNHTAAATTHEPRRPHDYTNHVPAERDPFQGDTAGLERVVGSVIDHRAHLACECQANEMSM